MAPPMASGVVTFLSFRPTRLDVGEVRRYATWIRSGDPAGGESRSEIVDAGVPWRPVGMGEPTRIELDRSGGRPSGGTEAERLAALRNGLPPNCRFDGGRVRLLDEGTSRSTLELLVLPVCRLDVDWSEETPF